MMKRSRLSSIFVCQALLCVAGLSPLVPSRAHADPEVVDGIAALVNGEPITFSEVRELDAPRERSLRGNYSGQELMDKLREARRGALQDLIDRQLILQEFKKKEFAIPPSMVEDRVNTIIREEFGGDRSAFLRTLQAQGFTMTKFKDAERDKIIVQAMRFQNVKGDFLVSPDRLNKDYQDHRLDYTTPEQVHLWMISISKGTPASPHEKDPQRAVAEEIHDKLVKGGKFEQMASLYSDDPSHADGDWGWIDHKNVERRNHECRLQARREQGQSGACTRQQVLHFAGVREESGIHQAFRGRAPGVREEADVGDQGKKSRSMAGRTSFQGFHQGVLIGAALAALFQLGRDQISSSASCWRDAVMRSWSASAIPSAYKASPTVCSSPC